MLVRLKLPLALLAATAAVGCAPRDRPIEPSPNTALGRPVSLAGAQGDAAVVTDGHLATEGLPAPGASVSLPDPRAAVVVDLGAPRRIGALLLQAGAADVYFVEVSSDAARWHVVWRSAPVHEAAVLRTRTTTLPRPVEARFVRARATTTRSAVVSELQVFEARPSPWPPLDTSSPDSPLPLWPSLTQGRMEAVYGALAALLLLVAGWTVVARKTPLGARGDRVRSAAFVLLALGSLAAWPNLGNFHYHGLLHRWELFHYYMGGKYLPELGYTRLYACTAVVDAEDGLDLSGRVMRDLRDTHPVPAEVLLEQADECRARFSSERWAAFEHDTRHFRAAMGEGAWLGVRGDHGFNGSPAWAVVAGLLARAGPASETQIGVLALLDVALMLGVFALIGRAFGLEAACLAVCVWGLNSLSRWGWTGGGLLRYDWVFWLVAGVAALRARRDGLAGFALACAALLRVFPVFALVGLGLKWAAEAVEARSLAPLRTRVRFAAGVAVASVLLLGGSSLLTGRVQVWGEFVANSARHLEVKSVNFVGLPVVLSYDPEAPIALMMDPLELDRHVAWKEHLDSAAHEMRVARWGAAAGFLLLLGLAVRRAPDWAAAVLGLGLMVVLLKLSSYYYAGLLVFATLWVLSPGAGLALAGFTWLTNVIPGVWPGTDTRYAGMSLAAVGFVTLVTALFAWRHRDAADPTPPPGPESEPPT